MINFSKILKLIIKTSFILEVLILLASCKNDIKKVQEFKAKQDSAIVSAKNIKLHYTINGKLQTIMTAPILNRYVKYEGKTYSEFPEGVHITFFDKFGKESSYIKANYSIYYEDDGIWEAQYDVVAVNEKGERLNTEYLIWKQKEETISSDRYVTMTTTDGIIHGKGFEANQDLSAWEIKQGSGIINVNEEEANDRETKINS